MTVLSNIHAKIGLQSGSYQWVILGVITVAQTTVIYSGRSIQPLSPFLQSELHLKYFQIGIFTSSFFLGAFFLSLPMGWLVDRIGVYWTIFIGQLVIGSFILSISFANSFLTICGFLFLAGMGHATINPATGKAVMSWFSRKGRATAMGVKQTGFPIGLGLAAATMPALANTFGWRKAFIVSGLISFFSIILCLVFYRESQSKENSNNSKPIHFFEILDILKNRDLLLLSGLMIMFMCLQTSLETYIVLFFKDRLLFSVITAGYFLSLAQLGGVVGRLTWGLASDFFLQGRRRIVLTMIGSLSFTICLSFAFLSPQFPIWLIVILVFLFGFCAIGWNGIYLTLVAEFAGEDRVGMYTGISLSIAFLGVLFGPPLFGYIVDVTESYSCAWFIFSIIIGLTTLFVTLIREPSRDITD